MTGQVSSARRPGRQPVTSRAEIEHAAFELFDRFGFEQTTVDDIAAAAGIARRTFFRYFASKNDVPWGSFDDELAAMRTSMAAIPRETPLMEAIRVAVLDFNTVDVDEQPWHRRRLALILRTPALQAYSTLRYTAWRAVVADYAADRLGVASDSLTAVCVGYVALAVAVAAYDQWLTLEDADLLVLLDRAFHELSQGFVGLPVGR